MKNILMVLGAQKTGTSTLVGLLNCHPDIFVSHEWFVNKRMTKYAHRFFRKYSIIERERFKKRKPLKSSFRKFNNRLEAHEFYYSYIGDKWPMLFSENTTNQYIKELQECYSIFMIRDLRTWLCHNIIQHLYKSIDDVVVPSIKYVNYFIKSFELKNCLRIRLDDLHKSDEVVQSVYDFLEMENDGYMQDWWDKIDEPLDDVKAMHPWWERHTSSLHPFIRPDISVEINKEHVFWQRILPIFDKYYDNPNGVFTNEEIVQDLSDLRNIVEIGEVKMEDCYTDIKNIKDQHGNFSHSDQL